MNEKEAQKVQEPQKDDGNDFQIAHFYDEHTLINDDDNYLNRSFEELDMGEGGDGGAPYGKGGG